MGDDPNLRHDLHSYSYNDHDGDDFQMVGITVQFHKDGTRVETRAAARAGPKEGVRVGLQEEVAVAEVTKAGTKVATKVRDTMAETRVAGVRVVRVQESRRQRTTARKQASGLPIKGARGATEATEVTMDGIALQRITKAGLTPNLTPLRAVGMTLPLTLRVC